ncbi:MAG: CHAT domain-containing protein [Planctomycetota bacterium]
MADRTRSSEAARIRRVRTETTALVGALAAALGFAPTLAAQRLKQGEVVAQVNQLMADGQTAAAEELVRGQLDLRQGNSRYVLLTTLASVLSTRLDLRTAWEVAEEARTIHESLPPEKRWSSYHEVRAVLALAMGQLEVAAVEFASYREAGSPERAHYHEAQLALAAEDYELAELRSRQLLRDPPPGVDAGHLLQIAAYSHWRQDTADPARSSRGLEELRHCADTTTDPNVRAAAHVYAGEICYVAGRTEEARAELRASGLKSTSDDLARTGAVALRARLALMDPATPREDLRECQETIERACQRELELWRSLPPRPGGVGILTPLERRNLLAVAVAFERRMRPADPLAGLDLVLRFDALNTLARRLGSGPATLDDVRSRLLPAEGAILIVLPSLLGCAMFWITRDEVLAHESPALDRVIALSGQMRGLLAEHDPEDGGGRIRRLAACGAAAAERLLPQAWTERLGTTRHLVVVDNSLLADLPFEALPGPAGSWLGNEVAISYLPSLAAGLALRDRLQNGAAPQVELALFAATEPATTDHGSLPPLDVGDLTESWTEPGPTSSVRAGAAATIRGYAELPSRSKFTWVLAHGTLVGREPDDSRRAALALAGEHGEALTCRDIESHEHRTACLLLSSCGGARGAARLGDATSSNLVGAFLIGGADAVFAADRDLELQLAIQTGLQLRLQFEAAATAAEALRSIRARCTREKDQLQALSLRAIGIAHLPIHVNQVTGRPGSIAVWWVSGAAALATLLALRARRR